MLSGIEWQALSVFRAEKQAMSLNKTVDNDNKAVITYLNKRIEMLEKKLNEPI